MVQAPKAEFVYSAHVTLEPTVDHGPSPVGHRYRVPITGGTFEGPEIKGRIVPGGADWQLLRADGLLVIEADYYMETDDGVAIRVHNYGLVHRPGPERPDGYVMTTPSYEAPMGRYGWLNQYTFCGTVKAGADTGPFVDLMIYRLV